MRAALPLPAILVAWSAALLAVAQRPATAAVCTPVLQWTWDGDVRSPSYPEACVTPLVVQLTDDNADSRIDAADVPDVVFIHSTGRDYTGLVTAVDGATGAEHWTTTATHLVKPTPLAAGDLDGDGLVDLVAMAADQTSVVCFSNTGAFKWQSDPGPVRLYEFDSLNLADLDQDGSPEIFVGGSVWNADGTFRFQGTLGTGTEGWWGLIKLSNAVDLVPASPGLELLAGNTAYDPQGGVVWTNPGLPDGWTAVADFEGDGRAEVVYTNREEVLVLDDSGIPLGAPHFLGGQLLRQPLVADLDADGVPEIVIVQSGLAQALEWGAGVLTVKWSQPISDQTGVTGCSAFDFDGDGAAEVLYHDEQNWFIFDGRTGTPLSRIPFGSATTIEVPVVADIDNDCVAEILVSGCVGAVGGSNHVRAYACGPSVTPRAIWNQYSYHVTNVNDDGTIPRVEQPPFAAQNTWLGQVASLESPVADAGPPLAACAGQPVTLDGSGSSSCGTALYRWLEGAAVVCDWSPAPTCSATPVTSPTTYTLEVTCGGRFACPASDTTTVTSAVPPSAAAGLDRTACLGAVVTLDGSGTTAPGCTGTLAFEWREGPVVVRPAAPTPTWTAPTAAAGTRTYTLVVTCSTAPGCPGTDDVAVTVEVCTLEVRFDTVSARRIGVPGSVGRVEVTWRTLEERDTNVFVVERAGSPSGPFVPTGYPVEAQGGGSTYTVVDEGAEGSGTAGGGPWYRVVEHTSGGRGSVSPVVAASADRAHRGAGGARKRR